MMRAMWQHQPNNSDNTDNDVTSAQGVPYRKAVGSLMYLAIVIQDPILHMLSAECQKH